MYSHSDSRPRKVVILGSSGSIGQSARRVLLGNPDYQVVGLAVKSNTASLVADAIAFGAKHVAVADVAAAEKLRGTLPGGMALHSGPEGVVELAGEEADVLLCAMVGMEGLKPVMRAIETGKDVALATKEVLVAAGEVVMRERERRGLKITPIDSEHSAIFQCLQSKSFTPFCVRGEGDVPAEDSIRRLLITASGGPFGLKPDVDFESVTVDQALNHPKWSMGRKITIDSATLMNKGLEIIEARWLFNVAPSAIEAVVHPESIVHSLVEFTDNTQLAELSVPDMALAINYALTWPRRAACPQCGVKPLDLAEVGKLTFMRPDPARFPALRLARQALEAGGTATAILNAANEVAVHAFLGGRISFPRIWATVEATLGAMPILPADNLDTVLAADAEARAKAAEFIGK